MSRAYAKALTKQDLIEKYHITDVDRNGEWYEVDGERKTGVLAKTPYGKAYCNASLIAYAGEERLHEDYKYKYAAKDGTIHKYSYSRAKRDAIGMHRLVYIWHVGDQEEGKVIDHIRNEKLDNRVENLQQLTPKENLKKERKVVHTVAVPKKTVWTEEQILQKLAYYTALYEQAKADGDQEAAHKLRTYTSGWNAKLRCLRANKELFEERSREKTEKEAKRKENAELRKQLHALKSAVKAAREAYKTAESDIAEKKAAWKAALKSYKDFKETHLNA